MWTRRHTIGTAGAMLAVSGAAVGLIIWPNHAQANRIAHRLHDLEGKAATFKFQKEQLAKLTEEVDHARDRMKVGFKSVPISPEVADLMRRLSSGVDGLHVKDQTFTAGQPTDAVVGKEWSTLAQPLRVEMVGSFSSIFNLVKSVEGLDRLVRVTTVRIAAERIEENAARRAGKPVVTDEPGWLTATIGLEVIFEPPAPLEDSSKARK